MRLKSVSIKNFRCYRDEVTVSFDDLTTFIGENDIGNSSVLEPLEIFFNNFEAHYVNELAREGTVLIPHHGAALEVVRPSNTRA